MSKAATNGISEKTLRDALSGIEPSSEVIRLDRNQPELKLTYQQYLDRILPASRIQLARAKRLEHAALLDDIESRFAVPARYLVALWAVESDFGRKQGTFPVMPSLATLAWEGRRSAYFEGQLMDTLRLIDAGHVQPDEMIGSWAGAMGHLQFMPRTLRVYWHDWNANGHIDVWLDPAEALASAANYLSQLGWKRHEPWGLAVKLPKKWPKALPSSPRPMSFWKARGIRTSDGRQLSEKHPHATLIMVEQSGYLVHSNYDRLREWNRSHFFALAVCRLADGLSDDHGRP